jgi:hypothetical protein
MFSDMFKKNPKISVQEISNSTEADEETLKHAMAELETFAHKNLTELSRMEKMATGTSPSIDMFCRIDVGIMQKKDGTLDYFVNEVERGPNVCLWAGNLWSHLVGTVGAKFGSSLHSWVQRSH